MRRRKGTKKQKNSLKKLLLERKNKLIDVKTQLQTALQLLEQEQQELLHMEHTLLARLRRGGPAPLPRLHSP